MKNWAVAAVVTTQEWGSVTISLSTAITSQLTKEDAEAYITGVAIQRTPKGEFVCVSALEIKEKDAQEA